MPIELQPADTRSRSDAKAVSSKIIVLLKSEARWGCGYCDNSSTRPFWMAVVVVSIIGRGREGDFEIL